MRTFRGRDRGRLLAPVAVVALVLAGCSGGGAPTTPATATAATSSSPTPSEAAASESPAPEATPTATPTPSPSATPTPKPTPTPAPTLTTPTVGSATISSTGAANAWKVDFKKPVVSGIAASRASAINSKITSTVNAIVVSFTKGLPPPEDAQPSTLSGSFSVAYASPRLLSLRLAYSQFVSGSAHPLDFVATLTFDLLTGKTIGFADLFTSVSSGVGILSTQSKLQLTAQLGADVIADGAGPNAANFAAWAFTPAGMEITFPEYAVAPYAAGLPVVVVAWSALNPVLKPNSPAAELLT